MDCFTSFKKLVSFTKIKNQLYKVSHTKPPLPLFFFALFLLFNFFAFPVKTYDTFDLFFSFRNICEHQVFFTKEWSDGTNLR